MTHPGVHIEEAAGGGTIAGVPTSITAFLGRATSGPVNDPISITRFAEFERRFGGLAPACPMSYAVRDFFLNGGAQALVVRRYEEPADGSTAGAEGAPLDQAACEGSRADKTGLFALEKADLFNLLCIPPDPRTGTTPQAVYRTALAYCEARRAMLIVDPPAHWQTPAAARDGLDGDIGLTGPAARNAALYFPRLLQADPLLDGEIHAFAPSGAVAGIMARTDAQRGVWKAPAGTGATLLGTTDLSVTLDEAGHGVLNPLGINTLRDFPGTGPVVWGSRTLRGADRLADEYKYIPVRRFALFLEASLDRGTRWTVFEPNGEPLWARIRLQVGTFLQGLFRQRAFQGATPREAYFVKAGRETMTRSDIDLGVLNIQVGFAPLKPAEFVIIHIRQQLERAKGGPSAPAGGREEEAEPHWERLHPVATWDDLVLPEAKLEQLRRVAEEARSPEPGICWLFAGKGGTGKTTAAEAVANHLGRELYRIDLSAVVSRYLGETEKHLGRLLDGAEGAGAILYFDEADALFGKRTGVRDSHDRYANLDMRHLLQRIEAHTGLIILATNRKSALRQAVTRRLRCIIDFPPPGRGRRGRIRP